MGHCVLDEGIAKERLASETDEVILLALAEAISIRPEINDFDLLAKITDKVGWLHVKYRVLTTIWQLITQGYIKKENVSDVKQILEVYRKIADNDLVRRIDEVHQLLIKVNA